MNHDDDLTADASRDELDDAIDLATMTEIEQLLEQVVSHVANARAMPMSASVMINRDEVLDLLDDARQRLPEELKAARWLLKEREDFLARTRREGDDILAAGRERAERMVQRTEVVKAAEHRARSIVDAAEAEARTMRLQCEDFCDQRLAQFEIVLERTMKMVTAGRERLAAPVMHTGSQPQVEEIAEESSAFFDQDLENESHLPPPPE
jgi:hypothetical protein